MYNIDLKWKEFNVSVPAIQVAITPLITSTQILGISCNSSLQIHCENEPTQEELDLVSLYWDELTEASEEATSHKSSSQIREEENETKDALLISAKAKLAALGLSLEEIGALLK